MGVKSLPIGKPYQAYQESGRHGISLHFLLRASSAVKPWP